MRITESLVLMYVIEVKRMIFEILTVDRKGDFNELSTYGR